MGAKALLLARLPANDGAASDERREAAEQYIFAALVLRVMSAGAARRMGSGSSLVGHMRLAQHSELATE